MLRPARSWGVVFPAGGIGFNRVSHVVRGAETRFYHGVIPSFGRVECDRRQNRPAGSGECEQADFRLVQCDECAVAVRCHGTLWREVDVNMLLGAGSDSSKSFLLMV